MKRLNSRTIAKIDLHAIRHNLSRVRSLCRTSKISAVVKADAYGHGVSHVFETIGDSVDAFAVATLDEAMHLRALGYKGHIWVFSGILLDEEITLFQQQKLTPVIHNERQLQWVQSTASDSPIILKVDSGMGRLGFKTSTVGTIIRSLKPRGSRLMLMGHFSHADQTSSEITGQQLRLFLSIEKSEGCERSIAASGGILSGIGANLSWVRPGLMLYGISPFVQCIGQEHELIPAMTLESSLIAIRNFEKGDSIGYGGEWICPEAMPVGFVGCGYGDGYPRSVAEGTCVELCGKRAPIIGRISMDSMAVDLRRISDAKLNDPVILWGHGLPIEEVARAAQTIPNEIFARLPLRVKRVVC